MIFSKLSKLVLLGRVSVALFSLGTGARAISADWPTPMPEDLYPELNAILRSAMTQSPQMIQKNLDLAQAEANRISAKSAMLPNVGISGAYNISEASVSDNTSARSTASGLYYSASVSQPLFRWGALKAQADAGKIQLRIAEKNYADAYRTLALTIRAQYLGLIARKMAVRNVQAAQVQMKSVLAQEEEKLVNGRISQGDIIGPRLQMQDSELATERTIEDFEQAKLYFMRITGLSSISDESIPTVVPAVEYDASKANSMLQRFLSNSAEDNLSIQAAQQQIKISELNYKMTKYRLYPQFSLSANVSQSNSTNASQSSVSQVGVFTQSAGVSMSWSIFDGFATRAAKMNALASIRTSERQLKNQVDAVKEQARSLERQLGFSFRAAKLANVRDDLSQSTVTMRRDDARLGVAAQSAVEVAQISANQSQLFMMNQRADFLSRWAEFVSTLGLDPILQHLPSQYQTDVH